jgi:hypothetical protein
MAKTTLRVNGRDGEDRNERDGAGRHGDAMEVGMMPRHVDVAAVFLILAAIAVLFGAISFLVRS